jgi:hypothetical protein
VPGAGTVRELPIRGFRKQGGHGVRLLAAALLSGLVASAPAAGASSASPLRALRYHGFELHVPRSWPVYDLAEHPRLCVRFNRHAVYLGAPGDREQCPAQAIGRTEAILIQVAPGRAGAARAGAGQATPVPALIGSGGSSSGWLVNRRAGVLVTASWLSHPSVIRRALGLRSLGPLIHRQGMLPPGVPDGWAAPTRAGTARRHPAAVPGSPFTGQGFDACSTPSPSAMSAWSPYYGAVGVYIGGVNEASCAGRGLTAGWVSQESGAGWHLIPIYVGRQAPGNACGCQGIVARLAVSEGRYAAKDAVKQARALGLGQGNPLYYDMEGYPPSSANASAVLSFLGAWTTQLHADGYLSGVYASGDSGVVDLVSQVGTGYAEPDDLWIARWNSVASTADPNVPSGYWPTHERLHQYDGGVNRTHGGVTINVDDDYVDGATAAAGTALGVAAAPTATTPPTIFGSPVVGQTLTLWHAPWAGVPSSYTEQWEDCDNSGGNCAPIVGATGQRYVVQSTDIGHKLRVVETASNAYGEGTPVTSNATTQVLNPVPFYWVFNASGHVYPSVGTAFYGSPHAAGLRAPTITGAAATLDGKGYWVVTWGGRVFQFGDAAALPAVNHAHPIRGIVAGPAGGYWLYTAYGNVYSSRGTKRYGSPATSGYVGGTIKGMVATSDGRGYWLVDSQGTVFNFGDASAFPPVTPANPVIGIEAAPRGGYWLYTAQGNVYPSSGTRWYGSPYASGYRGSLITGLVASPDGKGYWVLNSSGSVSAYGDAAPVSPVRLPQAPTGIFR